MGFLDKRGVKKVVDWVKEYVGKNTASKESLDNKQNIWDNDLWWNYGYLIPYKLNDIHVDDLLMFYDRVGNTQSLPFRNEEYKLYGHGDILNKVEWPSVFDMPWPNNEIPEWEDDHEYEIYIAGGRVVSVDDITPPVEEVSYTITTKDQGESFFHIMTSGRILDFYVDGKFVYTGMSYLKSITDKTSTFTYTVKGDLSSISQVATLNLQYIKVDCSKTKSNNLHKVLGSLKVDEIIYPQACVGYIDRPIYEFESPEVNLRCLKNNTLYEPTFNFKTDNFVNIFFNNIEFSTYKQIFGENISNINANKILRTIVLSSNSPLSHFNLEGLKTVGTLYDSIPIYDTSYDYFKFCNFNLVTYYSSSATVYIEADEFIFNTECSMSRVVIQGDAEPKKVFIENMENLDYTIVCEFDVPCTIYYVYGDPSEIHIIGRGENLVSFTKVNSVEEVPFQYAPTSWNDVKNYDDDGNVID